MRPPWPSAKMRSLLLLSLSTIILDNLRSVHLPTIDTIIELWPLCFVALVPVFLAQQQVPSIALIVFPLTAMLRCMIQGFPMTLGLGFGLLIGAAWTLLVAADLSVFAKDYPRSQPLRYSVMWVALWFALSSQIGTFELLSLPLHVVPWLIQPASVVGVFGIELLLVYSNLYLASLLTASSQTLRKGLLKTLCVLLFWVTLSLLLLKMGHSVGRESVTVATVTPGNLLPYACGGRKEIIHVGGRLPCNGSVQRMLELTESVAIDSGAKLVVWPEAWLSGFADQASLQLFLHKELTPSVRRLGIILTVGVSVYPSQNIAVTIDEQGQVVSVYGKQCPFWVAGERNTAKYGYPLFDLPFLVNSVRPELAVANSSVIGKAGTLICYDMDFPSTAREVANLGASIILNPSNDWSAMRNHFGVSVFRAIENGIPVVKADGAWDSAIIEGSGRVVASFQSIEPVERVLVGEVPLGGTRTIAAILGDLLSMVCFAYVVVVVLVSLRGVGEKLRTVVEGWTGRRRQTLMFASLLQRSASSILSGGIFSRTLAPMASRAVVARFFSTEMHHGSVTPPDAIEIDGDEYDARADDVLDNLFDAVDQACEKDGSKISSVDLHDGGVLEVETDNGQTFVINKHEASKLALNASVFDQFSRDLREMGSTALPKFRSAEGQQ
ncbi:hypothetical protein FOZ60_003944 [Perkinsus olseni]|uniref:CN hydrolase domain-containing protein n=1 Tax=Perkinsus olseni TaxID=32597 RepID=A0A7J6NV59_PEROL|nr:hypothetical protein FOZ60_003944 [Perkinsus olseni]